MQRALGELTLPSVTRCHNTPYMPLRAPLPPQYSTLLLPLTRYVLCKRIPAIFSDAGWVYTRPAFFQPAVGPEKYTERRRGMDKKYLDTVKSRLDKALDDLEDIVEAAQQNHHDFISQSTGLRRTIKSTQISLQLAEKSDQTT